MLSWAQKQRLIFVAVPLAVFLLIAGVFVFVSRNRSDCQNGRQDGNEQGVDCGGSCRLLCPGFASEPLIHFARAVPVGEALWGAVVLAENRNQNAGARRAPYVFKLYDADNLLIYDRRGEAYIPPRKVFAVFEGAMSVGSRLPTRAAFAFTEPPRFERMTEEPSFDIRNRRFDSSDGISRLEAVLQNPTAVSFERVLLTALLFDATGNVTAASATAVAPLAARASVPLSFTWPQEFQTPSRTEIFYAVPPREAPERLF
jgi:hypothetical protein